MKITLTLTHEKFDGIFYLEKDQITVVQNGQYWYTDVDEIMSHGIEAVHDDFELMLQIPLAFTYNDFYIIMTKLMAFSTMID